MNKNASMDIYGQGWAFPPAFNLDRGVEMVMNHEDIRQSLLILLSTQPGERIMRWDYGCDLQSLLFENIREELLSQVSATLTESIQRHEPRIVLDEVSVNQNPQARNTLDILIRYRPRGVDNPQRLEGRLDMQRGFAEFLP